MKMNFKKDNYIQEEVLKMKNPKMQTAVEGHQRRSFSFEVLPL